MRAKTGKTTNRRHKKILKHNKGYRLTRSKLYKVAYQAYMHAKQYSQRDRRHRHSQMRKIWIRRINAAAGKKGLKYNKFMHGLKTNNIKLNRKMLADIAFNNPEVFSHIVEEVKS